MLALLTTCGTAAPQGLRAGTGADASGNAAAGAGSSKDRELVGPSEYPADESLAEMVDPYEALICWFYLPDGGTSERSGGSGGSSRAASKDGVGGGGTDDGGHSNHGGGGKGGGKGYGKEVACFVAYHDEGTRRQTEDDGVDAGGKNSKKVAGLEAKRAAIAARARGRKPQGGDGQGGSESSASSGSGSSSDSGTDGGGGVGEDELDAEDFEPTPLRVRVILASPGTTQQLRKTTGEFLKTTRNRNPVSGDVKSYSARKAHPPPASSSSPGIALLSPLPPPQAHAYPHRTPPSTCFTCYAKKRIGRNSGETERPSGFRSARLEHGAGSSKGFEGVAPAHTGTLNGGELSVRPSRAVSHFGQRHPQTPALKASVHLAIIL